MPRNFTRSLKRARTRMLLEQMRDCPSIVDQLDSEDLDSEEVATFIVGAAKQLWVAATAANLHGLSKKLEVIFYEAYISAGGSLDESVLEDFKGLNNGGPHLRH